MHTVRTVCMHCVGSVGSDDLSYAVGFLVGTCTGISRPGCVTLSGTVDRGRAASICGSLPASVQICGK